MSPMPRTFGSVGEQIIASYNYMDVISGTGYAKAYLGHGRTTYFLSSITFYSDDISVNGWSENTNDWTKSMDFDFDVTLNKPLTLKGKAIVNVPYACQLIGTTPAKAYIKALLRKYSGSTETEIASSADSETIESTSNYVYDIACLEITVPLTHFKAGDILRLTIEGNTQPSGASSRAVCIIGVDPMSRLTDSGPVWPVTSASFIQYPVRSEL